MPLILMSGYPTSGKTHRTQQLISAFRQKIATSTDPKLQSLKLHHISDDHLGLPRSAYATARAEKDARATLASAIKRHLSRETIVIADAPNYIKGFRYQMYCEAKALRTPHCVVHVGTQAAKCRELNERALGEGAGGGYDREVFENLVFRFEEPNGMARWDAPLFSVPWEDAEPPADAIWDALVGGKAAVVRPNAATVLKPAAGGDYLYELDRATSEVVQAVGAWQRDHAGEGGGEVRVDGVEEAVVLPAGGEVGLPRLQRLRRGFIGLNRTHALERARVKGLFVEYLNDAFKEE